MSSERSEYSYIGLGDFLFTGKSLKICSRSVVIFRGFKRKANSTIEQQRCKGHLCCLTYDLSRFDL